MNQVQGGEPTKTGGRHGGDTQGSNEKKAPEGRGRMKALGIPERQGGGQNNGPFSQDRASGGREREKRGGKRAHKGSPAIRNRKNNRWGARGRGGGGFLEALFWGGGNSSKGRRGCLVLYYYLYSKLFLFLK